MPRRGENIRKRKDGRWEARYIKGYREDGKALYSYLYAPTYTGVKEKKRAVLSYSDSKTESGPNNTAVFDYAITEWLQGQRFSVKQSTYAHYRRIADSHIRPKLGSVRMRQISQSLLENFLEDKLENGRLDGKGGLSVKSVRDLYTVLRQIIAYAAEKKYMYGDDIQLKAPKQKYCEVEVMSAAQQARLESCLHSEDDACRFGVYLCLYTGLRIGELCALRWRDIQLDRGVLCVRRTMQRIEETDPSAPVKTKVIIDTPKSQSSLREIPLPSFLLTQLQHYSGFAASSAYLLTGECRYVEPRSLYGKYKGYLRESGIGDYTFHCLRHTFATRCIEKGFDPKSLSEILGHADVSITLRLYVHPSAELKRSHMERLAPIVHSWSESVSPKYDNLDE